MRSIIRQYVVYLLIALLPFQAAAASRMAACAEMQNPERVATTMTDHCAQLAAAGGKFGKSADSHEQSKQTGCWIGSICLAGLTAAAIPVSHQSGSVKPQSAIFPAVTAHYRSIILDDPQRPPSAL